MHTGVAAVGSVGCRGARARGVQYDTPAPPRARSARLSVSTHVLIILDSTYTPLSFTLDAPHEIRSDTQ